MKCVTSLQGGIINNDYLMFEPMNENAQDDLSGLEFTDVMGADLPEDDEDDQ